MPSAYVRTLPKAAAPSMSRLLLLIEVEGAEEEIDASLQQILRIASNFNPVHKRVAKTGEEAAAIWLGRKSAFGAMGRISEYLCMDGVIPLAKLSSVLAKISEICKSYKFEVANIFHAGDGNLHPLILYDANKPGEIERVEKCGAEILELCVLAGGCITGEHGVGIEKRDLMPLQFNTVDFDNQMRVKSLFDPDWRLNPNKVFPLEMSDAFRATGSSLVTEDDALIMEDMLTPLVNRDLRDMIVEANDKQPLEILGHGTKRSIGRVNGEPHR